MRKKLALAVSAVAISVAAGLWLVQRRSNAAESWRDVRDVEPVSADQVLVVRKIKDYTPVYWGEIPFHSSRGPQPRLYFARYIRLNAPGTGPRAEAKVWEYPSADWAKRRMAEFGTGRSPGPRDMAAKSPETATYLWTSGERVVRLEIFGVSPGPFLNAYLAKHPSSP